MSSWEEPGLNVLVPPVVKPDQQRGQPVGTVQKGNKFNTLVLPVAEPDQWGQSVGTVQKSEKKVNPRGWLALGVFFLTTTIGYGLMFLVIDKWLKG